MAAIHQYGVEFIGGPFDGYKHVVSFPPEDLAKVVMLPVNENVFRSLDGKPLGVQRPATSVAVYELCDPEGVCNYRYLGASPVSAHSLEKWMG
jgi:hypothetical protein